MKYLILIQMADKVTWMTAEEHDTLVAGTARFLLIRENNPNATVIMAAVLA